MKWSVLPWWLKAIVIIVCIVFLHHALKTIFNYIVDNKKEWHRQWIIKHKKIQELLFEKQRISVLIKRAKRYTRITLASLKATLLFAFICLTYSLVVIFKMDFFNAFGASAGTVVTLYSITAIMFNRRIRTLNELHDMTAEALEGIYQKRLRVDPQQIQVIDSKLDVLRKEVSLLNKKLRS